MDFDLFLFQSHKKVGALWREADLSWKDFLPEGEDVHNFLLEQVRKNKTYPFLFDSTYF